MYGAEAVFDPSNSCAVHVKSVDAQLRSSNIGLICSLVAADFV